MNGVTFGEKHSFEDFGLILSSKSISPPEPQTKLVTVPLRDGTIDLTESLTNDVRYNDRMLSMSFSVIDQVNMWPKKISAIENFLHGRRMKIIFDDDCAFYYIGRLKVNNFESDKSIGKIAIEGTVDPYKYDVVSSNDDWLWDPFDFDDGIINAYGNISVSGSGVVSLIGRRKKVCPIITVSKDMTVTFEGNTYNLKTGANKIYEILISEGENTLTFTGTGTVSIDYTGGSL